MSTFAVDLRRGHGIWSSGNDLSFAMLRNPHVSLETQSSPTRKTIIYGSFSSCHWPWPCCVLQQSQGMMPFISLTIAHKGAREVLSCNGNASVAEYTAIVSDVFKTGVGHLIGQALRPCSNAPDSAALWRSDLVHFSASK